MILQDEIETFLAYKSVREIPMYPISDIENILEQYGYERQDLDGEETNGWDVSFCYRYYKNDAPTVMIVGSLWYGDYKLCYEQDEN